MGSRVDRREAAQPLERAQHGVGSDQHPQQGDLLGIEPPRFQVGQQHQHTQPDQADQQQGSIRRVRPRFAAAPGLEEERVEEGGQAHGAGQRQQPGADRGRHRARGGGGRGARGHGRPPACTSAATSSSVTRRGSRNSLLTCEAKTSEFGHHFAGRAVYHHLPAAQQHHPVGHMRRQFHIMGGEDDGPTLGGQALQGGGQGGLLGVVQPPRRLIEQQDRRFRRQHRRQRDPLPLAHAHLLRVAPGHPPQAQARQQRRRRAVARQAVIAPGEIHFFLHRVGKEQHVGPLRHIADAPRQRLQWRLPRVLPRHLHPPLRRVEQPHQQFEQRRLARPVAPHQRHDFAPPPPGGSPRATPHAAHSYTRRCRRR